MRSDHHIDQLFRDQLQDYESPGVMAIWDKIEEKDKKTRPLPVWWWKAGLAILAILGMAIMVWVNHNTATPTTPAPVEGSMPATPSQPTHTVKDHLVNDHHTGADIPSLDEQGKLTLPKSPTGDLGEIPATSNTNHQKYQRDHTIVEPTQKGTADAQTSVAPPIANTSNPDNETEKSIGAEKTESDAALSVVDRGKNETADPVMATENIEVGSSTLTQAADFLFTDLSLASAEKALALPPLKLQKLKGPKGCYSFAGGRIKYDYFVDAFISPELVVRKLEAKNPEDESYLNARKASESVMYGMSGGGRLSIVTRGGLALRTGITYNRILERLSVEDETAIRTISTMIIDEQTGDTTIQITREAGTSYDRTYNRYRSLDIPLLLGYELDTKNIVVSLNGGVSFNIWAEQKGEILSASAMPVTINSGNPQRLRAFKTDLGMSIYGSIGLGIKMKKGYQLLVEPNFKYQLNPITLDSYPLEQQYLNMGMLLGLRKQF